MVKRNRRFAVNKTKRIIENEHTSENKVQTDRKMLRTNG